MANIPDNWEEIFGDYKDNDLVRISYKDGSQVFGHIIANDRSHPLLPKRQYPDIRIAGRRTIVFMDSVIGVFNFNVPSTRCGDCPMPEEKCCTTPSIKGEQPDHLGKAIQATVWAYTEGEQK